MKNSKSSQTKKAPFKTKMKIKTNLRAGAGLGDKVEDGSQGPTQDDANT
ncbi:MAG: hypothetical protein HRT35_30795 [Algicola sp.]|nr:hypothetical protein [Algicola sp.]